MGMREEAGDNQHLPLTGFAVSQPCLSSPDWEESPLQALWPQAQQLKAFHRFLTEISSEYSNTLKKIAEAQCRSSPEFRTVTV